MIPFLLFASAQAAAEAPAVPLIPSFFTAEALYEICRRPNGGQCSMYVAGALDGMFYARSRGGPPLCPERMNNREAADRVLDYLENNPELRDRAAAVAVRQALAPLLDCGREEEDLPEAPSPRR